MTEVLGDNLDSWDVVQNQEDWRGILIGNGFSQNIWHKFGYKSLLETASGGDEQHLTEDDLALFGQLGTENFEAVLSALGTSKSVARALGEPLEHLLAREDSIRTALVQAVHSVHISWSELSTRLLEQVSSELKNYKKIYSTNYDLLLYWAIMNDKAKFKDYFFNQGVFDFTDTRVSTTKTIIHYLHGGLHLYRQLNGQTHKRGALPGQNLLDLFGVDLDSAVPLFVSEGTAEDKLASINRSDYLSFVFSRFAQDDSPLVVFGHSLGEGDAHIADATNIHDNRSVAVSIHNEGNIRRQKASIIKALPSADIHFFDAATHPLGASELNIEEATT